MLSIERSTVIGTFLDRSQAEQAIAALKQAGFHDETIGAAGREEIFEKMETDPFARAEPKQSDPVVITVRAEERWKDALDILLKHGALETTPSANEANEEYIPDTAADQPVPQGVESHLEYDPVAGPRLVVGNENPLISGTYGLARDPALDEDTDDQKKRPDLTTESGNEDTFFSGSGASDDPNARTHY